MSSKISLTVDSIACHGDDPDGHSRFAVVMEDDPHPLTSHCGFGSIRSHDSSDSDGVAASVGSGSRGEHLCHNCSVFSFVGAPAVCKGPDHGRTDAEGNRTHR